MREFSFEIDGAVDFELGVPRTSRVNGYCAAPDGPAKGLVFLIPGFGDDAVAEYNQLVRRYLCGRHGLAAVTVAYHACQARPPAARIEVDLDEMQRLVGMLAMRGVRINVDFGALDRVFAELNKLGIECTIRAKLIAPNGDYQNFGVMQAIDHICALNHLLDAGLPFDTSNVLCLGSSHGAYIAHLIHKFAPNTINAVIDNSGYTVPLAQYLGGRPEYLRCIGGATLACSLFTKWNFAETYANEYFGPARYAIRDAANPTHLAEIAAKAERRCQFRALNSCHDQISPPEVKEAQFRSLEASGFDAGLKIVREGDLDGKVLKSLDHGLGASISGIFDMFAPTLSTRQTTLDRCLGTTLDYECYDYRYEIRHLSTAPYFEASCRRLR